MKGRALRIIVLLWIGWYLSGPLAETLDRWDGLRQEIHDVQFHAGGGAVLVAALFCFAELFAKKFRDRFLSPPRNFRDAGAAAFQPVRGTLRPRFVFVTTYSPPFPIRI